MIKKQNKEIELVEDICNCEDNTKVIENDEDGEE